MDDTRHINTATAQGARTHMSHTGILRSWNDDKGYGFIAPTHGGREVFVHISAFPKDGSRPTVGETLSFEWGTGNNGRPQATRVVRTAIGARQRPSPTIRTARQMPRHGSRVIVFAVLTGLALVLALVGYRQLQASLHRSELADMPAASTPPSPNKQTNTKTATAPAPFRCDSRTHCSQMTSCAEATWFLNHCPGTKMDGNNDGTPCEQQWCTSPLAR